MNNDEQGGDALDNLLRELRVFKATAAAMEPAVSRRIRTGAHELEDELSAWLGGSRDDYAEAFAPDEAAPETTLMRRLRTGQQ